MSQPPAELEKLRAELEMERASAIEAHRKLQDERRASDDNKAALKYAQEKLTTVREDLGKALGKCSMCRRSSSPRTRQH